MSLAVLVSLAVVVEFLVEVIKKAFPGIDDLQLRYLDGENIIALILGIGIAIGAGIDFFALVDIDFQYPVIGAIVTGIFLGGGSSIIHDLVDGVKF